MSSGGPAGPVRRRHRRRRTARPGPGSRSSGIRGNPGPGGSGRPSTRWPTRATAPPGSAFRARHSAPARRPSSCRTGRRSPAGKAPARASRAPSAVPWTQRRPDSPASSPRRRLPPACRDRDRRPRTVERRRQLERERTRAAAHVEQEPAPAQAQLASEDRQELAGVGRPARPCSTTTLHGTRRTPDAQSAGPTSSVRRSRARTTGPSKCALASAIHSGSVPGWGAGTEVGEDEGAHAVARRASVPRPRPTSGSRARRAAGAGRSARSDRGAPPCARARPLRAHSSSSPSHGTVSPAMTTDAPSSSTRNPTVGRTGAWSVGAAVTRIGPSSSTTPRSHSTTSADGRHCRSS